MKRTAIIVCLLALLLGAVSTVFAQGGPILVVNTSFLNVRAGDGPQFPTVATVAGGSELPVLGTNSLGTWYLVDTPANEGWVDVTFTLPRGDFSNVPVVKPADSLPLQLPVQSIGLAGAASSTQSSTQGSWRATIDVFSVNFRSQPADNGPIITTLYRSGLGTNDYPVLQFAYDSRFVRWIAITVPNWGTGWIEEEKTTLRQVAPPASTTTTASAANASGVIFTTGVSTAPARVVVNTGWQNVRLGPGPQFDVIATVPGGTSLDVIGMLSDNSWYQVKGAFGQGWISSEFVLFRGDASAVPVLEGAY
jgi:uncharacterized protein YgiM (DUF1202 family)